MNFQQAIVTCFSKYATAEGRASRSEYWYWTLFTVGCSFFLGIADGLLFPEADEISGQYLGNIFALATFLPSVAVGIRRLHDVNRSGWWTLIFLTGIGAFVLLYWACKRGTEGENRFGPDPLISTTEETNLSIS